MNRARRLTTRNGGFTLVELLLALTLMAMLMALAYGGLHAATQATDRGQTVLEDSSRIRMAHQFVHRQLNQMLPLAFDQSEDGAERYVFIGEPHRIEFVAPMPGYLGFGGPHVQELAIVPGSDGLQLVLSNALLQGFEEADLDQRPPIPLLGGIESAEFSFLGLDDEGLLTPWMSNWEDTTILPEAVSLDIEFKDDVYIPWPLLTAKVRIDGEALLELAPGAFGEQDYNSAIRGMINRRASQE